MNGLPAWPRAPYGPDGLGVLERRVMDVLWAAERALTVREIHAAFGGRLAYTTLLTTATRLASKGFLARERAGRALVFAARASAAEVRLGPAAAALAHMLRDDPQPALSFLVDAVSREDAALLGDLERLVRARRRR